MALYPVVTLVLLTSPRCPVCRYTQTPEPSGDNTCSSCDSKEVECRHYPVTLLSHVTLCYITLCYPVLLVLLCYPMLLCVTCSTLLPLSHVTLLRYFVLHYFVLPCVTRITLLPHVTLCYLYYSVTPRYSVLLVLLCYPMLLCATLLPHITLLLVLLSYLMLPCVTVCYTMLTRCSSLSIT